LGEPGEPLIQNWREFLQNDSQQPGCRIVGADSFALWAISFLPAMFELSDVENHSAVHHFAKIRACVPLTPLLPKTSGVGRGLGLRCLPLRCIGIGFK